MTYGSNLYEISPKVQPAFSELEPVYSEPDRVVPVPKYNKNLRFSVESTPKLKSVVLNNVEVPAAVGLYCETLKFERGQPNNGKLLYSFKPDGNEHTVHVVNTGVVVDSFELRPQPATLSFDEEGKKRFLIENLHNKDNLKLFSSKKIDWNLTPHPEIDGAFYLNFEPYQQAVRMQLKTLSNKGELNLIQGGNVHIAPRDTMPVEHEQEAPKVTLKSASVNKSTLYPPPQEQKKMVDMRMVQ